VPNDGSPARVLGSGGGAAITLADGRRAPIQKGARSALLFERGSLLVRFYAPEGVDQQAPHDQDEAYVVVSGEGWFVTEGERVRFEPGAVLFAAAGVEHRFENFTDDFATWVLFYGPKGGEKIDGGEPRET
jgi:mannose-6-phosphate isomerase-like protein (cupin superfamily)